MLNGVLKPYVSIHYDERQARVSNIVLSPLFSVVAVTKNMGPINGSHTVLATTLF